MGEIAALLTSACWAFSGIFFSAAGKRIGAFSVNRIRLTFATLFFMITHLIVFKSLIPLGVAPEKWFWFGLSGIVGLILGDTFLFQSFVYLGVRIPTLIMALVPVISTLFAWFLLDETLAPTALLGILITMSGIALVVLEQNGNHVKTQPKDKKDFLLGILCALGGATGQAGGLVIAKFGLQGDFPVLSGTLIRMLSGLALIWILAAFQKQAGATIKRAIEKYQATFLVLGGSIVGPYIGVWLSLIAVQTAFVGTASTLMALAPIILLPIAKWGYKENISRRAILGTFLSIAGVSIIFLG
jgi:drug/metabolite transporter (DMT)-like permease